MNYCSFSKLLLMYLKCYKTGEFSDLKSIDQYMFWNIFLQLNPILYKVNWAFRLLFIIFASYSYYFCLCSFDVGLMDLEEDQVNTLENCL